MERRDPKKQALAVGISIVLIVLIFFILTPPATAVYLDPGSPNPDSGEVGYEVTFNNVNLTIRGAERIPVDFLNFTIHNSDNDVVAWIKFYIDGTEISDYPSTALEVNTSTTIASSWYGYGTNTYGYDEEESYNLTGITGYGYGYITDITILYTINYTTQDAGTFYGKLSVNSTNYTYTSGQSSDFTVTEATSPDPTPSQPSGLSAEAGGPYTGLKGSALQFSGSASGGSSPYTYRWTFGDGGTGSGAAPSHTYTTAGTYTATLTVTDSESATDSDTATVTITTPTETTDEILNEILDQFGVELEEAFYGNDTDGDGKVDTLTDPNGLLTQVQNTIINDNAVILISTDDDDIPEFFWDADANTITPINQVTETESEAEIDTDAETITVTVTIDNKSGWIYIDITDSYPPDQYGDYTITITAVEDGTSRNISSDMFWRENGRIYILDDPTTEYLVMYSYLILDPIFTPAHNSIIQSSKPSITITYQEAVSSLSFLFKFNQEDILPDITKVDDMTYTLTPAEELTKNGILDISFEVKDDDNNTLTSTASYTIEPPVTEEPDGDEGEIPWLFITVAIILFILLFIIYLFKIGYLYVEYEQPEKPKTEKKPQKKTGKKKKK